VLISRGQVVTKTPTFPFTPATTSDWWYDYERGRFASAYAELYKRQLWVSVVVSKRARGLARLPLKVYERDALNRPEAGGHPYAVLLRNPNPAISPFRFWEWTASTFDVFGEAFHYKRRDRSGVPFQLVPLHPTGMTLREGRWWFDNGTSRLENIDPADVVHYKGYNPDTIDRGLSPLEPLRDTLENEANARTATSSFWRRGARPGFVLRHPGNLSQGAAVRLRDQFDMHNAGADRTGKTLVLEEGMDASPLTLSAEEAQYIDTRKLNREEVCAAYDVPPPVVHILDRATFSNITEQMRSMYRDTMAPLLKGFESDLAAQLQAPDFGEDVYAEFLMDEVLRGDFEARTNAYRQAQHMTLAEIRKMENLPYIPGTDVILVNTASLPLERLLAEPVPGPAPVAIPANDARSVLGRLGWQRDLAEVDARALTAGLDGSAGPVLAALAAAESVPDLKTRIKALTEAHA
jgi:HK97 family phage portal protein